MPWRTILTEPRSSEDWTRASNLFQRSATVSRGGISRSNLAWPDALERFYTARSAEVAAAGRRDTAALRARGNPNFRIKNRQAAPGWFVCVQPDVGWRTTGPAASSEQFTRLQKQPQLAMAGGRVQRKLGFCKRVIRTNQQPYGLVSKQVVTFNDKTLRHGTQ